MNEPTHGLASSLATLHRLSDAQTRSISPENPTGEPGKGGMAREGTGAAHARGLGPDGSGLGWKVSPSIHVPAAGRSVLADITGAGAIQHIWLTVAGVAWRDLILRVYWDGQDRPSIECPVGDFFCNGWNRFAQVSSLSVCVNPGRGFNCYWTMPFRISARIEIENLDPDNAATIYYQITYALDEVPEDAAYFHASFRRTNPLPYGDVFTLLDGVEGKGHFVGTYLAWGVNNSGWWGEGEVKFFLDGDGEFPTICGTGTEDYFCGAYNFDPGAVDPGFEPRYQEYTTPYAGLPQVLRPDGVYDSQHRFGLYRWHVTDPICFQSRLKVTIQALGWRGGDRARRRYLPLQDDIAGVAYWYQTLPSAPLLTLPGRDDLEII